MKACNSCGEIKSFDLFPKSNKVKSGIGSMCRACTTASSRKTALKKPELYAAIAKQSLAARRSSPERRAKEDARVRKWVQENKAKRQAWREANQERLAQSFREWRLANPDKMAAKKAARRAALKQAFPKWARGLDFTSIYRLCAAVTELTGIEHQVDHIIPLRGKTVRGLHVPWNLQVLPKTANQSKKNKLLPEHAG